MQKSDLLGIVLRGIPGGRRMPQEARLLNMRPTVAAFILVPNTEGLRLLFVESAKRSGKWSPVQGGIKKCEKVDKWAQALEITHPISDSDLQILSAMFREVRGEIGLNPEHFNLDIFPRILPHFDSARVGSEEKRRYFPVVAWLKQGAIDSITLNTEELRNWKLVATKSEAERLMGPLTHPDKKTAVIRLMWEMNFPRT